MDKPRRALIPGSFDPITKGHEALVFAASALFDEVVLALFINPEKHYIFTEEERLSMLKAVAAEYPNVTVAHSDGMVVDFVRREGISCIFKGIRNEKDLAYETEMAEYNLQNGGAPTLFLPAEKEMAEISSTAVREQLLKGILPQALVPEAILPILAKKMGTFAK